MILLSDVFSTFTCVGIVLAVIAAILFVVVFIVSYQATKQTQQIRDEALAFANKVNHGEITLFYLYNGNSSWHRGGCLVDENGIEATILPSTERELCIQGLSPASVIPSKAYRLAVEKVDFRKKNGPNSVELILQIFFRPAQNSISTWNVVKEEDEFLLLEHSLKGTLRLPKTHVTAKKGETVSIVSRIEKASGTTWRLTYNLL